MNITDITKLVSLILAVSIAGERLVTLIKTIFPSLVAPPATAQTDSSTGGIAKKVTLMFLAFLCCWLTASFLHGTFSQTPIDLGSIGQIPVFLLGLLASGGSAFWTNILGYVSALKDLNNQKAVQTKMAIQAS
jgi:hypothetical protein